MTEASDSLPAARFGITAIAIRHDYFPMLLSTVQRSPVVVVSFCDILVQCQRGVSDLRSED